MTNRFFDHANSNLLNPTSERPFKFARQQHLELSAKIDGLMLELERRYSSEKRVAPIARDRFSTVMFTTDDVPEPSQFDDFGLVQGLEIDVRWM